MARETKKKTRRGGAPPPEPPSSAENAWVARDEPFVFPADAPAAGAGRISLPSSGLASDILARAEAAALPEAPAPEAGRQETALQAPAEDGSAAHSISFFAAPVREEKKAVEASEHLVTFFLGGEEYGVDVRLVQEIIRVREITQVPRAPEFIKGVINLRGRIIPVADLKKRLGLGQVGEGRSARVVVTRVRERLIGLLVDGASQVLKVPVSIIEPAPEEVVEIDASNIRGVAKLEKRLIILLDLQRILGLEREPTAFGEAPARGKEST